MRSMTGFGSGKAPFGDGYVVLEIKTVNHRFLEIRSRSPRELLAGEALLEKLLRERLHRGYCMINLWYEGSLGGSTAIDKGALTGHLAVLRNVSADNDLNLTELIPVLAAAPDIFSTPRVEDETELTQSIQSAFAQSVTTLLGMRETEGAAMGKELTSLAAGLEQTVDELHEACKTWPQTAMKRLRERLDTLTKDIEVDVKIDQNRIASEVALLADRADVTEEITRLESHLKQVKHAVQSSHPVGRKLEFLIQELGREANTIASKTSLPTVSSMVIEIKAELEKMREIAQNIE